MERAAAGLLAVGLRPGERLGMWGPNTYEWLLMQFATAKAGIIMVGVGRVAASLTFGPLDVSSLSCRCLSTRPINWRRPNLPSER